MTKIALICLALSVTPTAKAAVSTEWAPPAGSLVHLWAEIPDAGRRSVWIEAKAGQPAALDAARAKFPPDADIHAAVFSWRQPRGGHHQPCPPTPAPVPLPAAAWLFGSALLGMVGVGARKGRADG